MSFIDHLELPRIMEIKQASSFDTPYVDTTDDNWVFKRLGTTHEYNLKLQSFHHTKLLKFILCKYNDTHMSPMHGTRYGVIKTLIKSDFLSSDNLIDKLEKLAYSNQSSAYFSIKSVVAILYRNNFPGFDIEQYENLKFIATPNVNDPFLKYQDVEETMPSHLKNLIVKSLAEYSTSEGLAMLSDCELENLSILGLSFSIGLRSAQFSMLTGSSVKLRFKNPHILLNRYEVQVPLAKQQEVSTTIPKVALSMEVGKIVDEYKKRFNIGELDALFPTEEVALSQELHSKLNAALFFIQPDETKRSIVGKSMTSPIYSLYDFRHNIGHSMAMNGASADEIAHILGHSSTVAAKFYIMSTPELALLKHKALGRNPIWVDMVGLLMTGYITKESEWIGKTVSGMLNGVFFHRIGGCNRRQTKCHLSKIRSCYGCFYFRPFDDLSKHQKVLKIVTEDLIDIVQISNETGDFRNPLLDTATETKNEVEMVISRIQGGLR